MKKISFIFSFLIIFLIQSSIHGRIFYNLDKKRFNFWSNMRPVIIFLTNKCTLGNIATEEFHNNFKDVKGVYLAAVNYSSYFIFFKTPLKTELGTILIARDGKIVASSSEDPLLIGANNKRRWVRKELKKLGNKSRFVKMKPLDFDRVIPNEESNSVNLKKNLIAFYQFNQNLKKSAGKNRKYDQFKLNNRSQLENGTLYNNGNAFKGERSPDAYLPRFSKPTDSFTIALNFKQNKVKKSKFFNWNVLFEVKNRFMTVFNYKNHLIIEVTGKGGYNEFYIFPETYLHFNKWHHLVISYNAHSHRLGIMVNGRRLKDVKMSSKLMAYLMQNYNPLNGVDFQRGGAPGGFFGNADNLFIYNRALNNNEMETLYKISKPGNNNISLE